MILESWRRASSALAITREDDWKIRVDMPTPHVIEVSDKARHLNGHRLDDLLRRQGYRVVERVPSLRAFRYVRPLLLWMLHRAGIFLLTEYWNSLLRLYDAGLIRFAKDEGLFATWRDIRPSLVWWERISFRLRLHRLRRLINRSAGKEMR